MIQCIALDLDRTTLEKDKSLSMGNRRALLDMIERGIYVVIASGRAFDTLPIAVTEIPGINYAITSNGAAVYRIDTRERIHEYLIPEGAIEEILKIAGANEEVILEAFVEGIAYADARYVRDPGSFGASETAIKYVLQTRNPVEDMAGFIRNHKTELDSIDFVIRNPVKKAELVKELSDKVEGIYVTSSVPELIEISHKDAGKHSGLQFLMEELGIKTEEIAAFGDADNDIDMLDFAGVGIAVGNASDSCKAHADFVTKAHDEDGVAYALYHYLKLPERKREISKKRVALHVSSITGNTRKLACGIAEYLLARGHEVSIFDSKNQKNLKEELDNEPAFDYHILCFWCRKSSLDPNSLRVLETLKGKDIIVLGTLGYYPDGDYADHVKENVSRAVSKENTFLGVFLSQGKMQEEKTKYRRSLPKDAPHYLDDEGYQRHLEARKHPNKQDIYKAISFIEERGL